MTFHCRYERAGAFTYPIDNATTLSITRLGREDIARKYDDVCELPMCPIHKLGRRVQREGQPPICVFCQWEQDGGVITVVGDQWAGGIVDKKKEGPEEACAQDRPRRQGSKGGQASTDPPGVQGIHYQLNGKWIGS